MIASMPVCTHESARNACRGGCCGTKGSLIDDFLPGTRPSIRPPNCATSAFNLGRVFSSSSAVRSCDSRVRPSASPATACRALSIMSSFHFPCCALAGNREKTVPRDGLADIGALSKRPSFSLLRRGLAHVCTAEKTTKKVRKGDARRNIWKAK